MLVALVPALTLGGGATSQWMALPAPWMALPAGARPVCEGGLARPRYYVWTFRRGLPVTAAAAVKRFARRRALKASAIQSTNTLVLSGSSSREA